MIFKALLRRTFRETKGVNVFSRTLCFLAIFYFQHTKSQEKAFKLMSFLQRLKQNIANFYLAYFYYVWGDFKLALSYVDAYLRGLNSKNSNLTSFQEATQNSKQDSLQDQKSKAYLKQDQKSPQSKQIQGKENFNQSQEAIKRSQENSSKSQENAKSSQTNPTQNLAKNSLEALYLKARILSYLGRKDEIFEILSTLLKKTNRIKTWSELAYHAQNEKELTLLLKLYEENKDNFAKFQAHKDELISSLNYAALKANSYEEARVFTKKLLFSNLKEKKALKRKKQLSRADAKEALQDLDTTLKKEGIELFFISGLFLGLIREKNFISHDYDLDVGVFESDLEKLRDIFIKSKSFILNDNGFVENLVQVFHINGVHIDVFMHYEKDGKIYHDGHFTRWSNSPFKLIKREFLGQNYLTPQDEALYLSENYGVDYLVPKNSLNYNTYLDTPNMQVTNKAHFITVLISLLGTDFALNNEGRILEALKAQDAEDFVGEYLAFKEGLKK